MKQFLIFICLSLFSLSFAQANDSRGHYETQFDSANTHYSNGNYAGAIENYEKVIQAGYVSSVLYFNLGNAYFKSGQLAPAILYFEKAKKISPTDSDIQFNLELASSQTTDKIESIGNNAFSNWWLGIVHWLHADVWGILAIALMLLLVAALMWMLSSTLLSQKRLALTVSGISLVGLAFCLLFGFQQLGHQTTDSAAIVFAPTVTVLSEPSSQGNQLFNLHEGTRVILLEERKGWFNIALSDGKTGWIADRDVRVI